MNTETREDKGRNTCLNPLLLKAGQLCNSWQGIEWRQESAYCRHISGVELCSRLTILTFTSIKHWMRCENLVYKRANAYEKGILDDNRCRQRISYQVSDKLTVKMLSFTHFPRKLFANAIIFFGCLFRYQMSFGDHNTT